jgi:hypothetical protein
MAAYMRDASELLYPAVCQTIAVLKLDPDGQDAAAAKLAQRYAKLIDEASDAKQANVLRWLGPELLKVLESLSATPAARAAITGKKGGPEADADDVLSHLKPRRRGA